MSKLTRKFLLSISSVLVVTIIASLAINANFIERYYIHERKKEINAVSSQLLTEADNLDKSIEKLEKTEDVVIVKVKGTSDNDKINERLYAAFLEKGLGLERYWLWDQDYESTVKDGNQVKIYNQGKLHYSLLVEYMSIGNYFIGSAMIIPNMDEMIQLISWVTTIIFMIAALFMILLICYLVKRITVPLTLIGNVANDISKLNFREIHIHSHDELEDLAENINEMSTKLCEVQSSLEEKNQQMERLLANVSHDLKTPVSLIKAYTTAMKEGMDDGTFLDTLIRQNEKMEAIIERLLDFSRIQHDELAVERVDLQKEIADLLSEYEVAMKQKNIELVAEVVSAAPIHGSESGVHNILDNLIINAVKYTSNNQILIKLYQNGERYIFEISNGIRSENDINQERLWEPFYVGEESRNKALSGTGLGLSIVRELAQKQGFVCECRMVGQMITFAVSFSQWNHDSD